MALLADLWIHSWSLLPPAFQAAYAGSPGSFLILAACVKKTCTKTPRATHY